MAIIYTLANKNQIDELIQLRVLMQTEVNNYPIEKVTDEYLQKLKVYFSKAIESKSYYEVIAIDSNKEKIVGTAGLCCYEKPPNIFGGNGFIGYVTNVYTLKDYRRQGIAGTMMKKISALATELKIDKLHLGASADGLSVYKSVGYAEPKFVNLEMKPPYKF